MIVSFRHKGLEQFYETGSTRGIQTAHKAKLTVILTALDAADSVAQVNLPGFKLHRLKGNMQDFWSVWVNGNWRVIFRFVDRDIELVDYLDYH